MAYFKIRVKQGHYGAGNHGTLTFAIKAKDILEAMQKAKRMPSVKHNLLVENAIEITKEEYDELRKESAYHRKGN